MMPTREMIIESERPFWAVHDREPGTLKCRRCGLSMVQVIATGMVPRCVLEKVPEQNKEIRS